MNILGKFIYNKLIISVASILIVLLSYNLSHASDLYIKSSEKDKSQCENPYIDPISYISLSHQSAITDSLTSAGTYLMFDLKNMGDIENSVNYLANISDLQNLDKGNIVVGFGKNILQKINLPNDEYYKEPIIHGDKINTSQKYDLILWIKANDYGQIYHISNRIVNDLKEYFEFKDAQNAFVYEDGKELSGVFDSIKKQEGKEAENVSIVRNGELEGSSFWLLQKWIISDWNKISQSNAYGNHRNGVRGEPMLRRSMPWFDEKSLSGGLMFSAFANSFSPFKVMNKMMKRNDEVFNIYKSIDTYFLWTPAIKSGRLHFELKK